MDDKERAELEMYRRMYSQTDPEPNTSSIQAYGRSYAPPAAQDALTDDELAAFWPEDLDYNPKWQIAERHRQIYSSWPKKND